MPEGGDGMMDGRRDDNVSVSFFFGRRKKQSDARTRFRRGIERDLVDEREVDAVALGLARRPRRRPDGRAEARVLAERAARAAAVSLFVAERDEALMRRALSERRLEAHLAEQLGDKLGAAADLRGSAPRRPRRGARAAAATPPLSLF